MISTPKESLGQSFGPPVGGAGLARILPNSILKFPFVIWPV